VDVSNATGMTVGYTLGLDSSAREHIVVVVKGTFTIPKEGRELELADEQMPLIMADTFSGEPGLSATVYESEFSLFKPYCDVLVNGSAWAPRDRPSKRVRVGLRVGAIDKQFDVVGDRTWEGGFPTGLRPGAPEPFKSMPVSYDRAYGGVDDSNPDKIVSYLPNIVGVGYHPSRPNRQIKGRPLPNTEEPGRPVRSVKGRYRPMSYGPLGRNFPPRPEYAGTYDEKWLERGFPFLPADFDTRYFQSAPPDQQMKHPRGGLGVELTNLTPNGRTTFRLPSIEVPVELTDASFERHETQGSLDTIVIEPDVGRAMLVWRASRPLKRNMLEMRQIVVGRMTNGWYRARARGKSYRRSGQTVRVAG
jgi:hypothetical protein